jgi:hypothetical protein
MIADDRPLTTINRCPSSAVCGPKFTQVNMIYMQQI